MVLGVFAYPSSNSVSLCQVTEQKIVLGMVSKPQSDYTQCMEKGLNSALELIAEIKSCTEFDMEALREGTRRMANVKNLIVSMKKHRVLDTLKLKTTNEPWNKKIDTKRNFYSTKASRRVKSKIRMEKPTWDERRNFLVKSWDAVEQTEQPTIQDMEDNEAQSTHQETAPPSGESSKCDDGNGTLKDREEDRLFDAPYCGRKMKVLYDAGWYTGDVIYFNVLLQKYCIIFSDGTDDYIGEEDIDMVDVCVV